MVGVAALLDLKHHRKIHLDTEVWSWGSGDQGQLGHADLLDRSLDSVYISLETHSMLVRKSECFIMCF